jgi:hypothetical protein
MPVLRHRAGACLRGLLAVLLLSQVMLAAGTSATPPLHTFTDSLGRTIQADILRVADPDVYLTRANGDSFMVKISVFTAADQTFIRQWAKVQEQANDLAKSALELSAAPNRIVGEVRIGGPQSFNVSLKNTSNQPLSGLTVSYILFRLPGGGGRITSYPLPRLTGDSAIKTIAANDTFTFNSTSLTNGNAPLAIWLRVYSSDGSIVQEWCSQPEITQFEKWDNGNLIAATDTAGK